MTIKPIIVLQSLNTDFYREIPDAKRLRDFLGNFDFSVWGPTPAHRVFRLGRKMSFVTGPYRMTAPIVWGPTLMVCTRLEYKNSDIPKASDVVAINPKTLMQTYPPVRHNRDSEFYKFLNTVRNESYQIKTR